MAGVFSRSWELTKTSFGVIKKDKELIVYPTLSMIFSLIFILAMLFPTIIIKILDEMKVSPFGILEYTLIFLTYLGLAFIATFFNVCVVYTASMRFSGKNATLGGSTKFAFSKIHLILLWSLVSATVGLLLRGIERIGDRSRGAGRIIVYITRSLLGVLWSIVSIFVVPIMVYQNVGPFKAIKKSVQILKKTWGESLVKVFTLGTIEILFILTGLFLFIPLIVLIAPLGVYAILIAVGLMIFYLLGVILVFNVANQIFNTALYVYSETGKVVEGYDSKTMKGAFKQKKNH